jgi:deoxyribodipyrimidine photolyase-related protein
MTTVWVLGDQLTLENAALAACDPKDTVVLLVESRSRGSFLRYHQHKLILIYAAMRHFRQTLEAAGWRVDYHTLEDTESYGDALRKHLRAFRPDRVRVMEAGDWKMTQALPRLARQVGFRLEWVEGNLFLVGREEFRKWAGNAPRLLMENHYRRMRKKLGILLEPDGTPTGGEWNLDAENRKTVAEWTKAGRPRPKDRIRVEPDEITRGVMETVARLFPQHPGNAADFWLPVSRTEALAWLERFVTERLDGFGPYEDLMLTGEPTLFHSVLTPMLNLGLLRPMECVQAALDAFRKGTLSLASAEGFIRQIIGWREFINGVYWLKGPGYVDMNGLGADRPVPAWFYTGETDLNCMRQVLGEVRASGYNHHIQRLMVLGNFMLLTGIKPVEALRWFTEMYVDAHDWVMAPNVVGMALHADNGYMATKPYAAAGAYISKMSDYCTGCRYRPTVKSGPEACPFNVLYWDFFARHEDRFRANPRVSVMVQSWRKKEPAEQDRIRQEAAAFIAVHVPAAVAAPVPSED